MKKTCLLSQPLPLHPVHQSGYDQSLKHSENTQQKNLWLGLICRSLSERKLICSNQQGWCALWMASFGPNRYCGTKRVCTVGKTTPASQHAQQSRHDRVLKCHHRMVLANRQAIFHAKTVHLPLIHSGKTALHLADHYGLDTHTMISSPIRPSLVRRFCRATQTVSPAR